MSLRRRLRAEREERSGPPPAVTRVLWLVDRFRRPLAWFGLDVPVLRALLEAKLSLDLRRSNVPGDTSAPGFLNGGVIVTCIVYAILGVMLGFLSFALRDPFLYVTLIQSAVLALVMMSLVVDFTNVLFDTADLSMIAPRPVADRTVLAARLIHIGIYLALLAGSITLGPVLIGAFVFNPLVYVPIMLFASTMSAVLAVGLVVALYVTVLRRVNPERFQNFVIYTQIAMTIGIFGGMQVLPPLLARHDVRQWLQSHREIFLAYPPAYHGGLAGVAHGSTRTLNLVLAGLAVAIPLSALWLSVRVLSSGYLEGLANMRSTGAKPTRRRGKRPASNRLARWVCRSPIERAGFEMTRAICHGERMFKMQTYSMLVFPVMFLAIPLVSRVNLGYRYSVGMAIMMVLVSAPTLFMQLRYSEHWEAHWIFRAMPIDRIGDFLAGMVKQIYFTLLVPYWIVLIALSGLIFGPGTILSAALASAICSVVVLGLALKLANIMPFAKKFQVADASGRTGVFFVIFLLCGVAAAVHALLDFHVSTRITGTLAGIATSWYLLRRLYRLRVLRDA